MTCSFRLPDGSSVVMIYVSGDCESISRVEVLLLIFFVTLTLSSGFINPHAEKLNTFDAYLRRLHEMLASF